jgi:hypothetical protein
LHSALVLHNHVQRPLIWVRLVGPNVTVVLDIATGVAWATHAVAESGIKMDGTQLNALGQSISQEIIMSASRKPSYLVR